MRFSYPVIITCTLYNKMDVDFIEILLLIYFKYYSFPTLITEVVPINDCKSGTKSIIRITKIKQNSVPIIGVKKVATNKQYAVITNMFPIRLRKSFNMSKNVFIDFAIRFLSNLRIFHEIFID